jgi:flagellar motility protein MotE (MotC chaperone)
MKPPAARPPRRPWRPGRTLLPLIAGTFAVAAVMRIGDGVGLALALDAGTGGAATTCPDPAANAALLRALEDRDQKLSLREGIIADRAQALRLAEQRIDERLATLIAAENALSKTVAVADSGADADVARLVTVYENMKPKEAAPLFETMAPEFAAGFLGKMRPEAAAAVLANLTPEVGYSISVIMAGRNAGVPRR